MIFSSKRELYFAFGSNMSSKHLLSRMSSAQLVGSARLENYTWCCNKLGRDGTAKANLMQQTGSTVFGVLYSIKSKQWKRLDKIESGYQRIEIEIDCNNETMHACTYHSSLITRMAPADDYMRLIIAGLIEHSLPAEYVAEIRREAGI